MNFMGGRLAIMNFLGGSLAICRYLSGGIGGMTRQTYICMGRPIRCMGQYMYGTEQYNTQLY